MTEHTYGQPSLGYHHVVSINGADVWRNDGNSDVLILKNSDSHGGVAVHAKYLDLEQMIEDSQ